MTTSLPKIERMKEETVKKSLQRRAAKKLFKEESKEKKEKKQRQNMKEMRKNRNNKPSCLYLRTAVQNDL